MITAPLAFADKCDKKKCDEVKEESTLVAEKCKKKCDKEEAAEEESTLVAEKCKKKCDKEEAAEESTLAHCGKCKQDEKHKEGEKAEEKKEGVIA